MSYQNFSTSGWNLSIFGTIKEITERHLSLLNWNATNKELTWDSSGRASCWTSQERMLKYFFNLAVMRLWGDDKKGKKHGVAPEAWVIAKQNLSEIRQEPREFGLDRLSQRKKH